MPSADQSRWASSINLSDLLIQTARRRPFSQLSSRMPARQGVPVRLGQGVLFTTYATLRSDARDEKVSRVKQIVEWVGADFDGVIIFDESHAKARL